VTRGVQGDARITKRDGRVEIERGDGGDRGTCAHSKDGSAASCAEVGFAAGTGVVGMGVGDDRTGNRFPRVNVEVARGAKEAVGCWEEEGLRHGEIGSSR